MGKFATIKGRDVIHCDTFAKPEDFDVRFFAKRVADEVGPMIEETGIQQMRNIMINKAGCGRKWDRCEVWLGVYAEDLVITGKASNGEQATVIVQKNITSFIADKTHRGLADTDYKQPQEREDLRQIDVSCTGRRSREPAQAKAALKKKLSDCKSEITDITQKYQAAQALLQKSRSDYSKLTKVRPVLAQQIQEEVDQDAKMRLEVRLDIVEVKQEEAEAQMLKAVDSCDKWHGSLNAIKHVLVKQGATNEQITDLMGTFDLEELSEDLPEAV